MTDTKLTDRRCVPCEGGVKPLTRAECEALMPKLRNGWKLSTDAKQISARFEFKNYFRTLAFVNAAAYVAITEDHHPDIAFGYNDCSIKYWTHAIDGLSENDFICAAKIDQLLA